MSEEEVWVRESRTCESSPSQIKDWERNRLAGAAHVDSVAETDDGGVVVVFEMPYGERTFSRRFSTPVSDGDHPPVSYLLRQKSLSYDELNGLIGCQFPVAWDAEESEWRLEVASRDGGDPPNLVLLAGGVSLLAIGYTIGTVAPIAGALVVSALCFVTSVLLSRRSACVYRRNSKEKGSQDGDGAEYTRRDLLRGDILREPTVPTYEVGDRPVIDYDDPTTNAAREIAGSEAVVTALYRDDGGYRYVVAVEGRGKLDVAEGNLAMGE